jgi:hypothetical protein
MIRSEVYRIEALINDSFEDTIKELIQYLLPDIKKIKYSKMSPDSIKVGGIGYNANFTKPDYLYITFNFLSKESWTNSGGHKKLKKNLTK